MAHCTVPINDYTIMHEKQVKRFTLLPVSLSLAVHGGTDMPIQTLTTVILCCCSLEIREFLH